MQEAADAVARRADAARTLLERAQGIDDPTAELQREKRALGGLLRRAEALPASSSAADLEELESDLAVASATLQGAMASATKRPAPLTAPADLRAAARAYFQGDYETTVNLLAGKSFEAPRIGAFSHLFLAAARFALHRISGESRLLRDAETDARTCRRLDPGVSPDTGHFSPQFSQFFRQSG
jgi:hypothetical protein